MCETERVTRCSLHPDLIPVVSFAPGGELRYRCGGTVRVGQISSACGRKLYPKPDNAETLQEVYGEGAAGDLSMLLEAAQRVVDKADLKQGWLLHFGSRSFSAGDFAYLQAILRTAYTRSKQSERLITVMQNTLRLTLFNLREYRDSADLMDLIENILFIDSVDAPTA